MLYSFESLLRLESRPIIGKKAESLLALLEQGVPVPPGAAIDATALESFLQHESLQEPLAACRAGTIGEVELQANFAAAPLPNALVQALRALLESSPETRWAVRSSGVLEDLAEASFAGLYTTVLNVTGFDEIVAAIKTCWASLFGERVQVYLQRQGLEPAQLQLGVVLQHMIPAQKSGVLFTVHPLSGQDTQMLIEAVPGLGEALVSGHLTPDSYTYDWRHEILIEQRIETQEHHLVAIDAPPFTAWQDLDPATAADPVLSLEEVKTICALALSVQQGCGYPVDIEWVWAAGEFYLVQRRPITKLHTRGIEGEWTTADFKDGGVSSDVCTPLMWGLYDYIWEATMPAYLRKTHLLAPESAHVLWGEMYFARPYWNVGAVKAGLKGLPGFVEREFDTDLGIEVAYEGPGHVTPTNPRTLIHGLKVLAALKQAFASRLAFNPVFATRQQKRLDELAVTPIADMTDPALFGAYLQLLRQDYFNSESAYFYHIFDNSNVTTLFKDQFKPYRERINYLALISGLQDLSHLRQNRELWDLSRQYLTAPDTLAYWRDTPEAQLMNDWRTGHSEHGMPAMRQYIHRFGHHSPRELDLTVARFEEDPGFVFTSLKQLLGLDDSANPGLSNQRQHQDYLSERAKLLKAAPWHKRRGLAAALDQLRAFLWWREELRDLSTRMYHQIRRWTLEVAKRLKAAETLMATQDIFFLSLDELDALLSGKLAGPQARQLVLTHRAYYNSFRGFRNPDEIGSRYSGKSRTQSGKVLLGVACSPGTVTGTARVIRDIFDADRLQPGDILITRFTDPGWTPRFSLLAGVATETGGMLSHAAVISREYGIPAVLAVPSLLDRVKDGQQITLDGDRGELLLE
ncbi:MAG: hypothetical protein CVV27_08845 [Candidatus Melainabacteria bacterium HGW-Melainabacteria-1]|nr:MAG: hypothetical protein CVV27_08845 [Candidatus Melainabacteria bacterium HGW-Melainabacteria-1]